MNKRRLVGEGKQADRQQGARNAATARHSNFLALRDKTYWTFTLAVRLPGLGKVRLVVSFDNVELTGTYAVLVTNRVDWDAQRIIALYLQRWPIEISQPYYGSRERLSLAAA